MPLTEFFQIFYRCSFLLRLMKIEYNFFLIDSLDVTLEKYMFNISSPFTTAKIEKNKKGTETYETPFNTHTQNSPLITFDQIL
jgi:hypothetical protein